jgi:hypothetical protein
VRIKNMRTKEDITKLNEKLQALYDAVKEASETASIIEDTFEATVNNDLGYLLCNIGNMLHSFERIGTKDGQVPEIHDVEIIFEAEGSTQDYHDMLNNMASEYPEFIEDQTRYTCGKETGSKKGLTAFKCHFYGLWIGDESECVRLTHHAEGMYENTGLSFVHVEVCIDEEWHGLYSQE